MGNGGSNKGKITISKPGIKKYIDEKDLDTYINLGWVKGNINDNQKAVNKKWYNNGYKNILIKDGEQIPEGFFPGMYQKRPGGYKKFNYHWYTDGVSQKRIKEGDTIPEGWYNGQCESHKQKNKLSQLSKGNYHLNNKNYSDLYKELYSNKEKSILFLQNGSYTINQLEELFNCTRNSIYPWLHKFDLLNLLCRSYGSYPEEELYKYIVDSIANINVIQHDRKLLNGKELDMYFPDFNIAIEFNGSYWHSSLAGTDKYYHQNKSKLCESIGIRLIHIYDYEWYTYPEKIKSLLNICFHNLDNKIYARKCTIRKITNAQAKEFNNKNHLQNHRNAQITYGLYYNEDLVQLMSFSKHRKFQWEIIRGCPGSNNVVVGGVSKLFNAFKNEYDPDQVFSYCDFNKFDGKSYKSLGMKFIGYTEPDKKYLINGEVVNRNPKRYKEYSAICDGILWGSGSKKYLWEKN